MAGRAVSGAGTATDVPAGPRRVDATRVLLALYGVFVVAAGARSAVQLSLHASRAPLPYALSAVAAASYATGFVLLRRVAVGGSPRPAGVAAAVELVGVLAVGLLSLLRPTAFPEPTVWSYFGAGYLWIPLLLPVATVLRLRSWEAWSRR